MEENRFDWHRLGGGGRYEGHSNRPGGFKLLFLQSDSVRIRFRHPRRELLARAQRPRFWAFWRVEGRKLLLGFLWRCTVWRRCGWPGLSKHAGHRRHLHVDVVEVVDRPAHRLHRCPARQEFMVFSSGRLGGYQGIVVTPTGICVLLWHEGADEIPEINQGVEPGARLVPADVEGFVAAHVGNACIQSSV
eukprot:scaffold20328_cov116-Isochrysis_galbana.AAC.12